MCGVLGEIYRNRVSVGCVGCKLLTQNLRFETSVGTDNMGDAAVDGMIILNWILQK